MNDRDPLDDPPTEKLRLVLRSTGPVAPEAGPDLRDTLQAGIPVARPEPDRVFRLAELPIAEEALERIRELAALNPQREAELRRNPPPPDAKAARIAELETGILDEVRDLFDLGLVVRVELRPVEEDVPELS